MFIRAHEAGYMCATTLSEKDLSVLASGRCPYSYLAQDKMNELDRQDKRSRSKSMQGRRAQVRIQEQLGVVNPVLVNPEEFWSDNIELTL